MAPLSILFGLLLSLLGVLLYTMSESKSPTALIPAFFGIALIVLGFLAFKEKMRKHAMHAAALLGLFGLGFPAYRVIATVANQEDWKFSTTGSALMAGLCGLFLFMCVKSFIDARRRRKQAST